MMLDNVVRTDSKVTLDHRAVRDNVERLDLKE